MEEKCTYSVDKEDCKCIQHCKKDYWNELANNELIVKVNQFWETIQKEIRDMNLKEEILSGEDDNYNLELYLNKPKIYTGVNFHSFQDCKKNNYCNFTTYSELNKEESKKITICKNKIEFVHCTFLEKLDFKNLSFLKDITFDNCIFKKEITFPDSYNNTIAFINDCDFNTNNINLSNKIFESSLFFKNCKNIGKIDLSNSIVKGFVSFKDADIKEANFEKASFKDLSVFIGATFQSDVDFKYTEFNKQVYFQNVTIKGELNLETAIFKDEVNFLKLKTEISNCETARIIKHSFEKNDNIIEANRFYALEMKAKSKELKFIKQPLNWTVFKLHKISSNYSQNYIFPILWIILISFINCNGFGLIKGSLFDSFFSIYYSEILNCMANSINPFSIMTGKETLTFGLLIYKSIIAYLIYQFIVSIRQNTRRK